MCRIGLLLLFWVPQFIWARSDIDSLLSNFSSLDQSAYVSAVITLSKELLNRDPGKSVELARHALTYANQHKLEKDLSSCLTSVGSSYFHLGIYDSSLVYLTMALETIDPEVDNDTYVDVLTSIGACYHRKENFVKTIESYSQALARNPSSKIQGKIFHNMAVVYSVQEDWEKALTYCEKGLAIFRAERDTIFMTSCINNLGNILFNQEKYDLALAAFRETLLLSEIKGDDRQKVMILNNIGEVYKAQGNLSDAEFEFRKAIKLNERVRIIRLEAAISANLADVLVKKKLPVEALQFYKQSLALCDTYHFFDLAMDNYREIADIYKQLGAYADAAQALERYISLKDSLDVQRQLETVLKLQDQFESQVKETEILRQQSEIQRLKLLRKNTVLIGLLIGFLAIGGMIIFIYNRYKESRRLNEKLREQNNFIQKQNTEIADNNQKLEYSNQELQQFSYIVSHDLREPLRTIANYSTLFAHRYQSLVDEEGRNYLNITVEGVHQLQNLFDKLLSYVVIQTRAYKTETVDLQMTVSAAMAYLDEEIKLSDARISIQNLPVLQTNGILVQLLFQHLIANAIYFRKPDTPPEILISAVPYGNKYKFSVSDNGIGMDAHHLSKIFSIFYQAAGQNESHHTGIGLAICQKIVRMHMGEIHAESSPGKGTTIWFSLGNLQTDSQITEKKLL